MQLFCVNIYKAGLSCVLLVLSRVGANCNHHFLELNSSHCFGIVFRVLDLITLTLTCLNMHLNILKCLTLWYWLSNFRCIVWLQLLWYTGWTATVYAAIIFVTPFCLPVKWNKSFCSRPWSGGIWLTVWGPGRRVGTGTFLVCFYLLSQVLHW